MLHLSVPEINYPLCIRCFKELTDWPPGICGTCADELRDRAKESEAMNEYDEGEKKL